MRNETHARALRAGAAHETDEPRDPSRLQPPAGAARSGAAAEPTTEFQSTLESTVCASCDFVHVPARKYRCQQCGARDLRPGAVALRGTLETYTRPRVTGHGEGAPSFGLAIIRLDDGPLVTARLKINGIPIRIGAPVRGVVERAPDGGREAERLSFSMVRHAGEAVRVTARPAATAAAASSAPHLAPEASSY